MSFDRSRHGVVSGIKDLKSDLKQSCWENLGLFVHLAGRRIKMFICSKIYPIILEKRKKTVELHQNTIGEWGSLF